MKTQISFFSFLALMTCLFTQSSHVHAQRFSLPGGVENVLQNIDRFVGGGNQFQQPPVQYQDMRYRGSQPLLHDNRPPSNCVELRVPSGIPSATPLPVAPQPQGTSVPTSSSNPQSLVQRAKQEFAAARYAQARSLLGQALKQMPKSSDLYQFRSATYFAEGKYDEAAADAYDAIKLGNIWNWAAMTKVYPGAEIYTKHLRQLEAQCKQDQQSMSKHFLLAYHYLVLEHLAHGERELKTVVKIQPKEPIASKLLVVVQKRMQK